MQNSTIIRRAMSTLATPFSLRTLAIALSAPLFVFAVGCNSLVRPQLGSSSGSAGGGGTGVQGTIHDDDGGATNAPAAAKLYLGALAPLTTIEHRVASAIAVPVSCPVTLRASASNSQNFVWKGLPVSGNSLSDEPVTGAVAQMSFARAGDYTITAIPLVNGIEAPSQATRLLVHALPYQFRQIQVHIAPERSGASGDGDGLKEQGVSAAATTQTALIEAQESLKLKAMTVPVGFEGMVEWRVDGQIRSDLASSLTLSYSQPGAHLVEGGNGSMVVMVYTVDVPVIRHLGQIPDGQAVTLEAVTSPAGYESRVHWTASTAYGSVSQAAATGASFTVRFDHTYGPDGWQNLAVQAGKSFKFTQKTQSDLGQGGEDGIKQP